MARSALRSIAPIAAAEHSEDPGFADQQVREAVLDIMIETSALTGSHYFQALTDSLAAYFGVAGVYLCELNLDLDKGRILASHESEGFERPTDFFGEGGVCEFILDQGVVVDTRAVVPFNEALRSLLPGTLLGASVHAQTGDPVGVLVLLSKTALVRPHVVGGVLSQLAPRVGAEIERSQQELALYRNELRLRLLTDRAKDVLFCYQLLPDLQVQYVSPAFEAVFGLPPESLRANPQLLFEMLDTEERRDLQAAFASGSEEPLIARVHPATEGQRWVEYRDFPIREDGSLVAIGGIIRDVTRRVEMEEALRTTERYLRNLLDSIPDTLLLVQSDGEVLDYKPGEVNTGLGDPAEVKGRNLKDLMSPAIVGVLERAVRAGSRSHRIQRVQFEIPGERPRHYDVSCLPFGEDALLLVLRDLTSQVWPVGGEQGRTADAIEGHVESRRRSNPYALTQRELSVLRLIVEGMADKQIADALGISIFTVNKHVGNILGKMNAVSRTEAGVRAIKESLLPSRDAEA